MTEGLVGLIDVFSVVGRSLCNGDLAVVEYSVGAGKGML